jgi:hypothetical protein
MLTTLKTLFLLMPVAWTILHGPQDVKLFFIVGLFAICDLTFKGKILKLIHVWPMILLGGLYAMINFLAPRLFGFQVADFLDSYNWHMICATTFYGISVGFCLGIWSQKNGQKKVFWGYALFCLGLAVIGWQLINAAGAEDFVHISNSEIDRGNVNDEGVKVLVFQAGNLIIDAIPMAIFAVTALPATLISKWFWPKLVIWIAAGIGIYFNVLVATRTMILAGIATLALLVPLQLYVSRHRKQLSRNLVFLGAVGAAFGTILLLSKGVDGISPLIQRVSNAGGDVRLEVWREAFPLIVNYPAGGGISHLTTAYWGHNLFLDSALINGLLGALVMLMLYGFIFTVVYKGIGRANLLNQPLGVALIGGLIGSFLASMVHPPQPAFIAFALLVGCYAFASMEEQRLSPMKACRTTSRRQKFYRQTLVRKSNLITNGSNASQS